MKEKIKKFILWLFSEKILKRIIYILIIFVLLSLLGLMDRGIKVEIDHSGYIENESPGLFPSIGF